MFSGIGDVDISERKLFKDISGLPLFFSTVIFAMEGIGTIMPIENSMTTSNFIGCPSVLNVSMSVVVVLYTVIGLFGYLRFGDSVHASITYDLPDADIAAQIAKACISISVFFTFMLQFYVPVQITWNKLKPNVPDKYHNLAQVSLRTVLVMFITGIAAAVPNLGPIIELVGSVFFSTLGLFIPAVIDTVLIWDTGLGAGYWKLWKNLFIVFLSLFALVSGSFYAIKDMFTS